MAQRQKTDITIYQGDTRSYKFTITSGGNPWGFASASAVVLGVKKTLDATALLFSVTATDGANGNNWAQGIAVFTISSAESVLLDRDGKYDVSITIGSVKTTPVYGDVLVQRQITSS